MLKRNEVEEKYKWDLKSYFTSDEKWDEEFKNVKPLFDTLTTFEGKLSDEGGLLECLNLQKRTDEIVSRLYVYISLKVKEDAKNGFYQNKANVLQKYLSDVSPKLSYIQSEINDLPDEMLNRLATDPSFADYDIMLKNVIKNKPHMLSKQEEKLMSSLSECIGGEQEVFDMLDAVDIKFEDATDSSGIKYALNNANYSVYLQSPDKTLRQTAFDNLNGGYGKLNYTLASNYLNNVKTDCTLAKVRHFDSAFAESVFAEDVDEAVYKTLVNMVHKNASVFHRYYKLKQKALNLDVMHNFDVYAKLKTKNTMTFSYDEAFKMVTDTLAIFGKEYVDILNRAKNERWIDVLPNENKDTGAFSWGAYGANPVVMLNFEGTINSVFTLAHELGHMMHTYYSNKNNPSTKAGYEIFVAEVASTVNEMLLCRTLLEKANDKEEKMFYIDYLMNMFYSTVFRQTMFSEFEYKVHSSYENGEDVTCDAINKIYNDLAKEYFGKDVVLSDKLKYEWSRIPHFYTSFYVYKYATGLISALAISNKILKGYKQAVKNYLNFLQSGSTKPPVELLKDAGVDLTKEETFTNAFEFISSILDEWEKLC